MDDRQIIKGIIQNHEPSFRHLIEKYQRLVFGSSIRQKCGYRFIIIK